MAGGRAPAPSFYGSAVQPSDVPIAGVQQQQQQQQQRTVVAGSGGGQGQPQGWTPPQVVSVAARGRGSAVCGQTLLLPPLRGSGMQQGALGGAAALGGASQQLIGGASPATSGGAAASGALPAPAYLFQNASNRFLLSYIDTVLSLLCRSILSMRTAPSDIPACAESEWAKSCQATPQF
jgi:hypothetical protein